MEFEWDEAKSERNRIERGLPFGLAPLLFEARVVRQVDNRREYGVVRVVAVGMLQGKTFTCVYTDRGERRGMRTGGSGMPIVRRKLADIDREKLLAELAAWPQPSEEEIERQAAEDGGALTDEEWANATVVYPPPSAEQVKAVRARLGLSQVRFALRFGFTVDTIRQYEQGRRVPSGPASTLLKVIAADPEAVVRALGLPPAAAAPPSSAGG